eukprot:g48891.t1
MKNVHNLTPTFFVFAANDPQVKGQLPTQSRVELLRKSGMSTGKLRDELYCIERKIQTGRKKLFKMKEMLETVLKAGKAGREALISILIPRQKLQFTVLRTIVACFKTTGLSSWTSHNWKRRKKGEQKNKILSRADPVRYSAAMKEKVQQFLHLKSPTMIILKSSPHWHASESARHASESPRGLPGFPLVTVSSVTVSASGRIRVV